MICKATTVYVIAILFCASIQSRLLSHTATRRNYYLHKYKRKVLSSLVLCEKLLLLNISSLINISYKKNFFSLFYAKKHIIFTYTEQYFYLFVKVILQKYYLYLLYAKKFLFIKLSHVKEILSACYFTQIKLSRYINGY